MRNLSFFITACSY